MLIRHEKRDQRSAYSCSSNRSPHCGSNCSLNSRSRPNQSQHCHLLDGERPSHPNPRVRAHTAAQAEVQALPRPEDQAWQRDT